VVEYLPTFLSKLIVMPRPLLSRTGLRLGSATTRGRFRATARRGLRAELGIIRHMLLQIGQRLAGAGKMRLRLAIVVVFVRVGIVVMPGADNAPRLRFFLPTLGLLLFRHESSEKSGLMISLTSPIPQHSPEGKLDFTTH
jgi:hypothetical protein